MSVQAPSSPADRAAAALVEAIRAEKARVPDGELEVAAAAVITLMLALMLPARAPLGEILSAARGFGQLLRSSGEGEGLLRAVKHQINAGYAEPASQPSVH